MLRAGVAEVRVLTPEEERVLTPEEERVAVVVVFTRVADVEDDPARVGADTLLLAGSP